MTPLLRWFRILLIVTAVVLAVAGIVVARLWQERPDVSELGWPVAESTDVKAGGVTVTWFGISTLLLDDGETQIMIDGAFTRLRLRDILTLRPVSSDIAAINHTLTDYRIDRLAAIVPIHSHFDHAIDAGHVANRSDAIVLGSESTASIARGAGTLVDQYQILASGESRQFGQFTITLIESKHAPIGFGDESWLPGEIDEPLMQPARVMAWKEGISYSVVIGHPRGTVLIQGSAGYIKNSLSNVDADVTILGVAGLASLGRDYAAEFWHESVELTGAKRVYPVHFDDFTQPLGSIILFPRFLDDVVGAAGWLNEFAADESNPVEIQRLPFGVAITLY